MIRPQTCLATALIFTIGACQVAPANAPEILPLPGKAAGMAPAEPDAPTVRVKETQSGDRACYMVLESGDSLLAGFDVCEIDLAGKTIRYQTEEAAVQSMDCEGDPECDLSDIVDLVVTVEIFDAQ